jgi:hypothetical protein
LNKADIEKVLDSSAAELTDGALEQLTVMSEPAGDED